MMRLSSVDDMKKILTLTGGHASALHRLFYLNMSVNGGMITP